MQGMKITFLHWTNRELRQKPEFFFSLPGKSKCSKVWFSLSNPKFSEQDKVIPFFPVPLELEPSCTFQGRQLTPLWRQWVPSPCASHLGPGSSTGKTLARTAWPLPHRISVSEAMRELSCWKGNASGLSQDCLLSFYSPSAAFSSRRSVKVSHSVDVLPSLRGDVFLQGTREIFCCSSK